MRVLIIEAFAVTMPKKIQHISVGWVWLLFCPVGNGFSRYRNFFQNMSLLLQIMQNAVPVFEGISLPSLPFATKLVAIPS
jgi:hypothetical protein